MQQKYCKQYDGMLQYEGEQELYTRYVMENLLYKNKIDSSGNNNGNFLC